MNLIKLYIDVKINKKSEGLLKVASHWQNEKKNRILNGYYITIEMKNFFIKDV
jgi:hypothetical protein